MRVRRLWGGAGVLRRAKRLLARSGVGVARCHEGRRNGLLRCRKYLESHGHEAKCEKGNIRGTLNVVSLVTLKDVKQPQTSGKHPRPFRIVENTHVISRGAPASSCAPPIAVLARAPLRGGGVGVLALACDCGDGVEHLRGHVTRERVDSTCQVWGGGNENGQIWDKTAQTC